MTLDLDSLPAFQTDKLPELREYIQREGVLLKGEALELANALYYARKQVRDADEKGCAREHLADWHDSIAPLVQVCDCENIREMKLDRARRVLMAENSTLCAMLGQIQKERKAKAATA